MLEHVGLDLPELGEDLVSPRYAGQAVQVGVNVLGDQLLGHVGGEQVPGHKNDSKRMVK